MEKILIIDNYDSFTYNLVEYVRQFGYEVDVYRNDEISIEEIDTYSTIILSPGPGIPKEAGLLKSIIEHYGSTKKILGVCLGMQAIGEVYGGKLENLATVVHGISSPIKISNDNDLFKDLPIEFNVGRYHSWVVSNDDFPEELEITSIDKSNQIMSFEHKKYNVHGVQFHPESILTEHGMKMIQNFLEI